MTQKTLLSFGYHDLNAPRHRNICSTLKSEGYNVIECHTEKRGFFAKCCDLRRQFCAHKKEADTVLVTFPGHYLVPIAWLLTRFPRKKLIFDAFLSLHDTLVCDRKKVSRWNPYAWFLYLLDWISCHLADQVIIDTEAHRQFFIKRFHLRPERVRVMYLGTHEELFRPAENPVLEKEGFDVLFYGTYIPLQGVEHIIDAAQILQNTHSQIHFTLIGGGQTYMEMQRRAEEKGIQNITFRGWVPYEELPSQIQRVDLCLGIFGTTDKAQRVIPHKVYDAVACGVPIITARTPAILEKFQDGKEVILCEAGNPKDLAEKIAMQANPR